MFIKHKDQVFDAVTALNFINAHSNKSSNNEEFSFLVAYFETVVNHPCVNVLNALFHCSDGCILEGFFTKAKREKELGIISINMPLLQGDVEL